MFTKKLNLWIPHLCICGVVSMVTSQTTSSDGVSDVCAVTLRKTYTWLECEEALQGFVGGDVLTAFNNTNHWWWQPLTEPELRAHCKIYTAAKTTSYMMRSDLSPEAEQHLATGFHAMLDYILCDTEGAKGYLYAARHCLHSTSLEVKIQECFQPFKQYSQEHNYRQIGEDDDLIHEHCDVFKKYQQCRIDVFKEGCNDDVAEWNDDAIVKFYGEYMGHVKCEIGDGVPVEKIVFIICGCLGSICLLFCFCFCCSRFDACHGHDEQLHHQTKKFWNTLNAKKKGGEKSEGVDNKGFQKDSTDVEKGKPAGGYYNTRERDNNDDNDKRERESRSGRRLEPIDEREEYTRRKDKKKHRRDRSRDRSRDRGRDYRREYPHHDRHQRGLYPGWRNPFGRQHSRGYDDNFQARMQSRFGREGFW